MLILPVAVFGGFLYHALFEAKAQYALAYLPMLLPYAARALTELLPQKQSTRTVSRNKT